MKPLKILLTNETGCFEPGIIALAKVLSIRHRVCIVAPLSGKTDIGHALTIDSPIRVEQFFALSKAKIYGVNGTPCDCVGLALDKLLKSKPDLIISGIGTKNSCGEVIYTSGITSSAILGTIYGVKSIALSADIQDTKKESEYLSIARAFSKKLELLIKKITTNITLNVNYPAKFQSGKIKETHLTMGTLNSKYTHEVNPFGIEFYWHKNIGMNYPLSALDQKGDLYWLKKGFATVTPLKYDLTSDVGLKVLEGSKIKI